MTKITAPASDAAADARANHAAGQDEAGDFGALFATLLGQASDAPADPALMTALGDPHQRGPEDAATEASLAAMLPFLEAMGLAKPDEARRQRRDEAPDGKALDILAAPVTPAVMAEPAMAAALSPRSGTAALGPLAGLAEKQAAASEARLAPEAAGRAFAEELVGALEAGRDDGRAAPAATLPPALAAATSREASNTAPVLNAPVGTAQWQEEVGNRVVWMANRHEGRAELVLTPPELGRVEVKLSVAGDVATASFASANPQVREALEAALPRLKEIFAQAGLELGQAQVGTHDAHPSSRGDENGDNSRFDRGLAQAGESRGQGIAPVSVGIGLKMGRGLIDIFA
ncbi:MAG: flagellar hook-length control protein FliK [Rhodocyclaceae bacterium]|nr:flagellar hook-length control protein FliK [Rhodocyclaceae bacterium]